MHGDATSRHVLTMMMMVKMLGMMLMMTLDMVIRMMKKKIKAGRTSWCQHGLGRYGEEELNR